MTMYLAAAFVLLLAMLVLVLRPFLYATVPAGDAELDLTDPAAKARSVAKVERVSRSASAGAAAAATVATEESSGGSAVAADATITDAALTDAVLTDAPVADAPPVDGSSVHDVTAAPPTADEVRASVEAAIAARKAALKAKHCSSCEAVLEDGDAFCRTCGTKATA
jgi:hypothetical protein